MKTIIKTKDFTLRPFKKGDQKSLAQNINDKYIHRNTSNIPYPYTTKDAKDWIKKKLKEKNDKAQISFVIDIGGEVAGSVTLFDLKEHRAEIGYWLSRKHRGRGIMTKAVKVATAYWFKHLKLKRIQGIVYVFNNASAKVLKKSGFKLEGILRKYVKRGGKYADAYLLATVK